MEIIFVFFATQRYSILQNFIYFEYFSVKFGLPLHRPRIGPRRGGHAPQPHVPPGIFEPDALAYGRFVAPRDRTQRIGGFLAGGDEGTSASPGWLPQTTMPSRITTRLWRLQHPAVRNLTAMWWIPENQLQQGKMISSPSWAAVRIRFFKAITRK